MKNKYFLASAIIILSIIALCLCYLLTINITIAYIVTLGLAILLIVFSRTDIALYLAIFSIVAGQLVKIPLGESGGTGIIISDILVPIIIIVWLFKKIKSKEKIFPSTTITPFILIFLGLALSSYLGGVWLLDSTGQAFVSLLYLFRLVCYFLLYFVGLDVFKTKEDINTFKKVIFVVFILVAVLGLLQMQYFPKINQLSLLKSGWDPHIKRLFSTFLDPNFAGAFFVIGTITALSFLLYAKSIEGRVIFSTIVGLSFLSLILTYSRSSYLFFIVSFAVFTFVRSRKLFIIGLIAAFLFTTQYPRAIDRIQNLTNFEEDASFQLRLVSWEKSLTIIQDYPIFGIGYNTYRYAQIKYGYIEDEEETALSGAGSDSSLLTILVTTGIFGLIFYILFYYFAIKQAWDSFLKNTDKDKIALSLALFSSLIGLLVHSVFVNSLLYPHIMMVIFLLLSIVAIKKTSADKTVGQNE